MRVTLKLRYQAQPQHIAAAWLIPGGNTAAWLTELIAWKTPLERVRLYVVPPASGEQTAALLAVPPAGVQPVVTSRAQGYALLAGRLYLPVESRIEPPVEENELAELLPAEDEIYVWRPNCRPACFPHQSALRVADLLHAPQLRVGCWDRAQPGTAVNRRLHSVEPDEPLDLSTVLKEGGGDIGTLADLKQLPPTPREQQSSALSGAAGAAQAAVAKVVAYLASLAPQTASHRTWINDLQEWAGQKLEHYSEWLHERRYKELARLLDMLTRDPDEGLKHALPMGRGDYRGIPPRGDRLVRHDVHFHLDSFNGGGPADVWDVPADYRLKLMARYRELANREIALGRHRRAAYIFADLLGDLHAAAATLADGGHFREAAALYQERLGQPLDAAHCLRRGGFWQQAIDLYQQHGQHETVGALYRELDEPDLAEQAYRQAVAEHTARMDYLKGAKLLEQELKRPDEARDCLLLGWPYSGQAELCLSELFKLLARQAKHDQAAEHVRSLPDTVVTSEGVAMLATVLADVTESYPDAEVQLLSADQTRAVAASRLQMASPAEARTLTEALRRLAPQDRLLARDCQRFSDRRAAAASQPVAPPRVQRGTLKVIQEIKLEPCQWKAFVASGDVFYAAGLRDDEVILIRGLPDGTLHQPHKRPWRVPAAFLEYPILLAADPNPRASRVYVHVANAANLEYDRPFPPCAGFDDPAVAGPCAGFNFTTTAIHYSQALHIAEWTSERRVAFITHSADGRLIGTHDFKTFELPHDASDPQLHVRANLFCFSVGSRLAIWDGRHESIVDLPHPIHSLTGSLPHTRHRIAAAMEQGAVVFFGDPSRVPAVPFAEDLHRPALGLTRLGHLVAASATELQVYETQGGRLRYVTQVVGIGAEPVAVLATLRTNEFIVAHANGHLLVYRIE